MSPQTPAPRARGQPPAGWRARAWSPWAAAPPPSHCAPGGWAARPVQGSGAARGRGRGMSGGVGTDRGGTGHLGLQLLLHAELQHLMGGGGAGQSTPRCTRCGQHDRLAHSTARPSAEPAGKAVPPCLRASVPPCLMLSSHTPAPWPMAPSSAHTSVRCTSMCCAR